MNWLDDIGNWFKDVWDSFRDFEDKSREWMNQSEGYDVDDLLEKREQGTYYSEWEQAQNRMFGSSDIYGVDPVEEYSRLILFGEINPTEYGLESFINDMGPLWEAQAKSMTNQQKIDRVVYPVAIAIMTKEALSMVNSGIEYTKSIRTYNEALRIESQSLRAKQMISKNIGYNVSPENWFSKYKSIGKSGTYITDYKAISDITGPIQINQKYSVGLVSGGNKMSYYKTWQLERALGLNRGSLMNGFRITEIKNIVDKGLSSPIVGNKYFLGPGMGLPGGGPEFVINPIPTKPWP